MTFRNCFSLHSPPCLFQDRPRFWVDLSLSPPGPSEWSLLHLMLPSACLSFQNPVVSQISPLNPALVCQHNLLSSKEREGNPCWSLSFDSRVQGTALGIIKPGGPSKKKRERWVKTTYIEIPRSAQHTFALFFLSYTPTRHAHTTQCVPVLELGKKVKTTAKAFSKEDNAGFWFLEYLTGAMGRRMAWQLLRVSDP